LRRYEALFLFDTTAAREWAAIEEEVRRLCGRIGAELLVCVKFDERKLAYEIARRKRGTYVLAYFDAPSEKINDMERDIRLSELILRGLVLRAEKIPEERIAELRAHPPETPLSPMGGDGRRHDDDRRFSDRHPAEPPRTAEAEKPREAVPIVSAPSVATEPPGPEST
jgi:small subunit ribosomal protein S6